MCCDEFSHRKILVKINITIKKLNKIFQVRNLLVKLSASEGVENNEFVTFLTVIVNLLQRDPSLIGDLSRCDREISLKITGFFFEYSKYGSKPTVNTPAQLMVLEGEFLNF